MLNTRTDRDPAMMDEAERSKERVRQLLSIQIEAQLAINSEVCTESDTWEDFSYHGENEAIGV